MEFIREQIKEKPINKRKILRKVGVAALSGATFAVAACMVVLLCLPSIREAWVLSETEDTSDPSENSSGRDHETESEDTYQTEGDDPQPSIPDYSLTLEDYQKLQNQLYQIGRQASASVVTVTRVINETDWMNNDYETEGQGSGVIVSEDENYLYILAERWVIAGASRIRISFMDDTSAEAMILKSDGNTGMTILTVEKRHMEEATRRSVVTARFGNSSLVSNGTIVIALGSPLGANYSILAGNVTSVGNQIMTLDKNYAVLTTNIVANEDGTGILVNTKGELIGMVIQAFSGSQDASTLTAVAISEIKGLVERLQNDNDIPHIGLYISTVTKEISQKYDIPKGVFVKEVLMDSPAMYAGLQSGDVITHINGEPINTDDDYSDKIQTLITGTTCEFTVKRQSGKKYYEIKCEVRIGTLQ